MDFKFICRTCLQELPSESLFPLNIKYNQVEEEEGSGNENDEDSPTILEMLTFITTVSEELDLPQQICNSCLGELSRTFIFKQRCEESEQTLRDMMIVTDSKGETHIVDKDGNEFQILNEDLFKENVEISGTVKEEVEYITKQEVILLQEDRFVDEDHEIMEEDAIEEGDEEMDYITITEPQETSEENVVEELTIQQETEQFIKPHVKCDICGIVFIHKKSLNSHMIKSHSDELVEEKLDLMFQDDKEGKSKRSPKTIERFNCQKCGSPFSHKKSLANHIKYNRCPLKSFKCTVCGRVFVRKTALLQHMMTHDPSKIPDLKCELCKIEFENQEDLEQHIKDHCSSQKKHRCVECGKSFTMFSTLKDHMRTHSGEKPFLCSICGKGFSQSTNMKQHVMRHNKTKPFKCDECTASFVSKGELDAHLRKHSGEHPFKCDTCGSGFTTSSSLVKHRRIHTGERPYACEYCPMRFSALGTLKNHRRTHTGERPYACSYCTRTFVQKSDMASHMRTHTGERPYVCDCGMAFLQSSALKSHKKIHEARLNVS